MTSAIVALPDLSSNAVHRAIQDAAGHEMVFVTLPGFQVDAPPESLERMRRVARTWGAGLVYSDSVATPRIDCSPGSIRDDFDFGALVGISTRHAREVLSKNEDATAGSRRFAGLYELRLRLGESAPIVRVPEPLYAQSAPDRASSGEAHFDYVDPSARGYQVEMEAVATAHLVRIGAYLPPRDRRIHSAEDAFPVTASVVIPVRNREHTIGDAVRSALEQQAPWEFNVIVVDNRSTDRTGEVLDGFDDPRLVVKRPDRNDLGIGGCWNLAVESPECGRYALQLDSDDLFAHDRVIALVGEQMKAEGWAMLVGSYTTVDFQLNVVAPGLVDHREWSDNGHNNLLRVNGLGAPRAFDVATVRSVGFPNVSYGEDYAVGLRLSREFALGRIYDSLYWCRRWEGNTDSSPTIEQRNRFNTYKDWLRTTEIRVRQSINATTIASD